MWIFLGRFGCQMFKPPQDVYHLTKWWILMYTIFGHFLEGLDVKCPNRLMILKLCIYYGNRGHWYSQIWIFFRRFGCQVSKFPLDFVSPNKIQDVDVHNSRYSHEGLDSNVKTTLWYSSCVYPVEIVEIDIHDSVHLSLFCLFQLIST